MLVLAAGSYLGIGQYQAAYAITTLVSLDVNPSIALNVSAKQRVISAEGNNSDGEAVLASLEQAGVTLEGQTLDNAVKLSVGEMVDLGYISQEKNAVLVSVSNDDAEKSAEIEVQLTASVQIVLSEKGIDGAVLGQPVTADESLSKLAQDYGISTGKAELIQKIITQNPQLAFSDLAVLNITELTALAGKSLEVLTDVSYTGSVKSESCVNAQSAVDSACSAASITVSDDAQVAVSVKADGGALIYSVSVDTDDAVIQCQIDAQTGKILSWFSNIDGVVTGTKQSDGTAAQSGAASTQSPAASVSPPASSPAAPQIPDNAEDFIGGVFDFISGIADRAAG